MSVPATYLELLQTKIIPNTESKVYIKHPKIVDKRRDSTINRNIVLDRLQKNDLLIVKQRPSQLKTEIYVPDNIPTPTIIPDNTILKSDKQIVLNEIESKISDESDDNDGSEETKEDVETKEDEEVFNNKITEMNKIKKYVELENPVRTEEEIKEEIVEEILDDKQNPTKKPKKIVLKEPVEESKVDLTTSVIRTQKINDRLPIDREKNIIKAPPYYMNNRKLFIQKINKMFSKRENEILESSENVSCNKNISEDFNLLAHQSIVRDYLNLYTPYRGLLLYHGLGSGKTCSSIAIAEGMKSNKQVFILTPASLKMNYFSELKKCGDELYKKNKYWEFISIDGNPEYLPILSTALSLPVDYVRKNNGAWLVNINKSPNFSELNTDDKNKIDLQLNQMIRSKYKDINYNGLNMNILNKLTENLTKNPFDNAVIIIDEAHNFVSRIVNKIKSPNSISYILYDYLMKANNCRIVLLSGTPIINYPNEIGILYNILRGYIKTWTIPINVQTSQKIDTNIILTMFDKGGLKTYDFVEYSGNKLTITKNPYGFINMKKRGILKGTQRQKISDKNKTKKIKGGADDSFARYDGVKLDESGNLSDKDFIEKVTSILKKNNLEANEKMIELTYNKCLPDSSDTFLGTFVNNDTATAQQLPLFQRRILGLTSYFRSAQENLLPSLVPTEKGDDYHIVYNEMSDYQFGVYTKIRKVEADKEKVIKRKKNKPTDDDLFKNTASTYRIFSRAACNFVFPDGIERPVPNKNVENMDENDFDVVPESLTQEIDVYSNNDDNKEENSIDIDNYAKRIEHALTQINTVIPNTNEHKYFTYESLEILSPKFLNVLQNLLNPDYKGLHLLYSHFRTLEGIGILRLILLANGFAEFKIKRGNDNWEIVEHDEDKGKPKFVLYTGTESAEEKEIIRNIYNGSWEFIPVNIASKLKEQHENNRYGEIIKIFMITASGAEGINLKNTRYVHIIEPYWHMVRVDQVVGRARRICSHQDLPEELQTVQVFLYVTSLSQKQKTDDQNIELRIRDISRLDKKTPVTTDETLYEIASMKQRINNQILQAVKETAVDCHIYAKTGSTENPMVCYGYGKIESNTFGSYPSFEVDSTQKEGLDVVTLKWDVQKVTIHNVDYALKIDTNELYDYTSYNNALSNPNIEPIYKGKLIKENGQYKIQ